MAKELKIPKKLVDVILEYEACIECRDSAITLIFRPKIAINYAKKAQQYKKKFWLQINKLYPETVGEHWQYNYLTETISEVGEDND